RRHPLDQLHQNLRRRQSPRRRRRPPRHARPPRELHHQERGMVHLGQIPPPQLPRPRLRRREILPPAFRHQDGRPPRHLDQRPRPRPQRLHLHGPRPRALRQPRIQNHLPQRRPLGRRHPPPRRDPTGSFPTLHLQSPRLLQHQGRTRSRRLRPRRHHLLFQT